MKPIIQLAIAAASAALLSSCTTCKIEPPPTVIGTDKEGAAKLAASTLPGAIANAQVSGNYKNVVKNTYATIPDDDVVLYLLLEAYTCDSSHYRKDAAAQVLQLAREELHRRHGASPAAVQNHPNDLTPTENRVLSGSPLKPQIKVQLAAPTPPTAAR